MKTVSGAHLAAVPLVVASQLTCTSSAQTTVTISGTLDMHVNQLRRTLPTGERTKLTSLSSGGIQTPTFRFSGSEDLGGDLRATFELATYMTRADSGAAARRDDDPFFSAGANVGLASKRWGTVRFGRIITPSIIALFDTNAWLGSTTYGASFLNNWGGTVLGDTGFSNSMRYDSPSFGGIQAQLMYSLGDERSSGPDRKFGRGYDWRLDYLSGPLRVALSGRTINQSAGGNGLEQRMTILGATYDFKAVAVFGQYVTVDDRFQNGALAVDRAGLTVGVRVPIGPIALIASTARARIDDESAATPSRRRTTAVGADYFLSKRTDLYVAYSDDRLRRPEGVKSTRLGVGVRHKF